MTILWKESADGLMLLSIRDAEGEEIAGAVYDPETDEYDTRSDGCGILCDESHPDYTALEAMDWAGDWPSPTIAEGQ